MKQESANFRQRKKLIVKKVKALSKEAKAYFFALILSTAYSSYYIFNKSLDERNKTYLGKGWSMLHRMQDVHDQEWRLWFSDAREVIILMYLGHFLTSVISNRFLLEGKRCVLFMYGVLSVFRIFGKEFVALVVAFSVIYICIAQFRSVAFVILASFFLPYYLPKITCLRFLETKSKSSIQTQTALFLLVFRCASVALEKIKNPITKIDILRVLRYNFYSPYFFFGPLMTYDAFNSQRQEMRQHDLNRFIRVMLRTLLTVVAVDFLRHFVHISVLPHDKHFMKTAPLVVIGFLAFVNFYFDWTKGRILYCVAGGMARSIDGFVYAPKYGKDIATIYSFYDVYIDRGLQQFIRRYIYNPALLHYEHEVYSQLMAGAFSFIIVIFTVGGEKQTIIWAILSWVGLALELCVRMQHRECKRNKRLISVASGLNYWAILLINCIPINGLNAFYSYFHRIFVAGGLSGVVITIFIGYMYAFITLEVNATPSDDDKDGNEVYN